jgi:hypothetical protein
MISTRVYLFILDRYEASGYGWDDDDKMMELREEGTRFLLVREQASDDDAGDLVAFVHFRFTVQGEVVEKMAGEVRLFRVMAFF